MKTIYYIGLACLLFTILSCEKEFKAPAPEATKMYIALNRNTAQVNGIIDFGDLSSNVVSRTWTFPDGVTDILESDNDVTSSNSVVHATFNTPGVYNVQLNMVFGDKLVDDGPLMDSTVIDTVMQITILDSVRVNVSGRYLNSGGYDSAALDMSNGARNQLYAGEFVRYTFTGVGGPTNYVWDAEGGSPEYTDDLFNTIVVQYKQLGTFSLTHIAYRNFPQGSDTIFIPNLIEVIPSPKPVVLNRMYKRGRTEIVLDYSRSIADPSNELSNFSIQVRNGADVLPINIVAVSLDPQNDNMVVLTLDADIYDDDGIMVTYTPGELQTTDGIAADGFTNQEPILILENIIPDSYDAGFENISTTWEDQAWAPPYDASSYTWSHSTRQAHSGFRSGRIQINARSGMALSTPATETFTTEEGIYQVRFWIYVVEPGLVTNGGLTTEIALFHVGGGFTEDIRAYTEQIPVGQWQEIVGEYEPGAGDQRFYIRGMAENSDLPVECYIDDISVSPMEVRPE